jgi:hypothetical protein
MREPTTTLERYGREFARAFEARRAEATDGELVADLTLSFLPSADKKSLVGSIRRRARYYRQRLRADPLGAEMLALVDSAHARVRNSPLATVPFLFELDHGSLLAYSILQDAQRERSNERAVRLYLLFVQKFLENRYHRYVRALDILDAGRRGVTPAASETFGEKVRRLSSLLPTLVEPDAARIRNAIEHGQCDLLLDRGELQLQNLHRGEVRWQRRITLDELIELVKTAEETTEALARSLQLFVLDGYLGAGVFDFLFSIGEAHAANDFDLAGQLSAESDRRMREMFAMHPLA